MPTPTIPIPTDLLPADGRFGCGPSKVRPQALNALLEAGSSYLGTSHRQTTVRNEVARLRRGLGELFSLPPGYEIVLGNGGTTALWDVLLFSLWNADSRAQFLSFGEFSAKFAAASIAMYGPDSTDVISAEPGSAPDFAPHERFDIYAYAQCETSTGVAIPVTRPKTDNDALVLCDATSIAGGIAVDVQQTDVYYFAPQKCFGSDGGLWIAILSPKALARMEHVRSLGRHIPAFLDLSIAVDNSRLDQTYNTPALATIFLAAEQTDWFLENGGLAWCDARCRASSAVIYDWAEARPFATPSVKDPSHRSPTMATIDFNPDVDAAAIAASLRAAGVVDVEPYRKFGRNQLRIATFPAIEPSDLRAVTQCIDYLVEKLS